VKPRLRFYKSGPEATKAMTGPGQITCPGLEKLLVELTMLVNTINSWNRFAIAFLTMPA
jgi:hypothetical protein